MKSVTLFLIVAVSGLVVSSPDSDLIGPILKTINSYANLTRMADYLKQFPESFNQDFPAIAPGKLLIVSIKHLQWQFDDC